MKKAKSTTELGKLIDLSIRFDYLTALRMNLDVKSLFPDYPHE
jgi:hypothetical protein